MKRGMPRIGVLSIIGLLGISACAQGALVPAARPSKSPPPAARQVLSVEQGPSFQTYLDLGAQLPERIAVADADKLLVRITPEQLRSRYGVQALQEPAAKVEANAVAKSDENNTKLTTKEEAKPDIKDEAKPDIKDEAKPDIKDEAKPDLKDEGKLDVKDEGKLDVKDEGKLDVKDETKLDIKDEAKPPIQQQAISQPRQAIAQPQPMVQEQEAQTTVQSTTPQIMSGVAPGLSSSDVLSASYMPVGNYMYAYRPYGSFYYPDVTSTYSPFLYGSTALGVSPYYTSYGAYGWGGLGGLGYFGGLGFGGLGYGGFGFRGGHRFHGHGFHGGHRGHR